MRTYDLFTALTGSQSYGMALPGSDDDRLTLYVAAPEYYLGVGNLNHRGVEQNVVTLQNGARTDYTYYELRRWLAQAAAGSPAVMQVLHSHDSMFTKQTPLGAYLLTRRSMFVTKKVAHTFGGNAFNEWREFCATSETAPAWKKAANAMRLWRCGAELLNTGAMQTWRVGLDSKQLMGVRTGSFTLSSVKAFGELALTTFTQAQERSTLPEAVDAEAVDTLATELVKAAWVYFA